MSSSYDNVPSDQIIDKAVQSLKENGISASVVDTAQQAKDAALKIVPKGSRVLTPSSITVREIGLDEVLNGPDYVSVKAEVTELYGKEDKKYEQRKLGSVPEVVVSSVHALSQDGKILIASATGSQIPSEAYGADKVVLVVGAQKIVEDLQDGLKRIEEYVVPLEDKRMMKAYGSHTSYRKLLIINKEAEDRIHIIIVKEKLGF